MMETKQYGLVLVLASVVFTACVQKYDPPAVNTDPGLLVVDGFLNNGPDTSFLRLSRSRKLQDGVVNSAELNAFATVETEDGGIAYYLRPLSNGNYFAEHINLAPAKKYYLHIQTSDGREYRSDGITVKDTPAIDSISWRQNQHGVTIYANAHDAVNNTRFYRWDYTETYKYFSAYYSSWRYDNGVIYPRTADEQVYECWKTNNSTSIILGTSVKLSEDRIYLAPVRVIPQNAIEISSKYSILLRQYALSRESFEYYENLKKITEQQGSIFDAQPSQLTGNIHCITNTGEVVLGFITASSMQSARIFIDHTEVNNWNYPLLCEQPFQIPVDSIDFWFKKGSTHTPIDQIRNPSNGVVLGYTTAQTGCVDCVSRGGLNIKPNFWP